MGKCPSDIRVVLIENPGSALFSTSSSYLSECAPVPPALPSDDAVLGPSAKYSEDTPPGTWILVCAAPSMHGACCPFFDAVPPRHLTLWTFQWLRWCCCEQ